MNGLSYAWLGFQSCGLASRQVAPRTPECPEYPEPLRPFQALHARRSLRTQRPRRPFNRAYTNPIRLVDVPNVDVPFNTDSKCLACGRWGSVLAAPAVAALAPVNSGLATYAHTLPLLGLFNLAEEGAASLRGLNEIRRQRGLGEAMRNTPRLAAAYGAYVIPTVASMAVSKRIHTG